MLTHLTLRSSLTQTVVKRGKHTKVLKAENLPKKILATKYAVRGEMVIKANKLAQDLKNNAQLPFKKIVFCNIGNPQELGQMPITYFRQVLSLVEYPQLLDQVKGVFPDDVVERAMRILKGIGSSSGAYTHSQGYEFVREDVCRFIRNRDGHPEDQEYSTPGNIFLTDGASPAVQKSLSLVIEDERDGILIPIPQYPLYSATIPLLGGTAIPYYLDENDKWGLSIESLKNSIEEARAKGITPKGLVVINPGNPTGSCLSRENMEEIVQFCGQENIALMADEVYQENVYVKEEKPFVSFKKVVMEAEAPYNELELFSFHSISKGFVGECGHRGGYVECTNIDQGVIDELYKIMSINLCPNVTGQLLIDLMVRPPVEGEASYELYEKETRETFESLKRRANRAYETLNGLPMISCNAPEGSMYAFPQIELSEQFIEEAKAAGKAPDLYYCLQLLEAKGICVVPGSGFGQKEGTFHFRTTFLPQEEDFDGVMNDLADFHRSYLQKYT